MEQNQHYLIVARKEFTDVLVDILYRPIYVGLQSMWEDSKTNFSPREVYGKFQEKLLKISKWNQEVISKEHRRIVDKSKCEYLDGLIRKVFILHTQLLAATSSRQNRKIKLNVPRTDDFIHKCYEMCGRALFENPLLMEDRSGVLDTRKRVRNLQECNAIIKECICTTIRTLLPVSSLLQEDDDLDLEGFNENTQNTQNIQSTQSSRPSTPVPSRASTPPPVRPRIPTPPPLPERPTKRDSSAAMDENLWTPLTPSDQASLSTKKEDENDEFLKVYFAKKLDAKTLAADPDSDTDSEENKSIQQSRDADPISLFKTATPNDQDLNLDVNSDELPIRKSTENYFSDSE